MALAFEHFERRALELRFLIRRPRAAGALDPVALDGCQHACRLFAAHHRNAAVRPGPQEARRIGPPRHAVVTRTIGSANQHGDLGYIGRRHRRHQFGAMFRNALGFIFAPDHEAGDVLQKHQWNVALAAKLDEMRALQGRFGEQHAVIGDNPHRHAIDAGKTADQSGAVACLELIEIRTIDQPRDNLAHIIGNARIGGNDAQNFLRVIKRCSTIAARDKLTLLTVEIGGNGARNLQCMGVVIGQMVGHAGKPCVHVTTAEIFRRHHFAGCSLHQRRTGQKDRALIAHDHRLVAHGRHVSTACRARPHDHGDLRNACRRHLRLIVEDAPEMVAVREHLILIGQIGPAGIDQIDAGQTVLARDLLRAQMLLHCDRIIGAALHRRIVADDHAVAARYTPDAGDNPARRSRAAIHAMGCRQPHFQKGRPRIEQLRHALARKQFSTRNMAFARFLATAIECNLGSFTHHVDRRQHRLAVSLEAGAARRDFRFQNCHQRVS